MPTSSNSRIASKHEIVSFDSSYRSWLCGPSANFNLLLARDAFLFLHAKAAETTMMLEMWLYARGQHLVRMGHQLWIQRPLIVAIVSTFLNYVLSLGSRYERTSLLYLPVDEFDFLLDLFEKLLEATLLKDGLCTLQIVLRFLGLWWVANHEQSSNDLEGLGDIYGAVSMQCVF